MKIISRYINYIQYNGDGEFVFCGDGSGDFEEHGNHASDNAVKGYIECCKEQIELAEKYLGEKNDK
jgi:hypothetical protein